ncbi:hypothetical protein A5893_00430 [Pedobacter psychrophilus]|uniref:Uncharacterized protein n=2 Tax=Pedobacter psychrophilus TaxID=1826909 RepID=A0A179DKR1_9SPHI|nr:hypothetical protein A5893_00430 [Pedobacter psychrophilus]
MSGIMIYDLLTGKINFWLAFLAFGSGNLLGYLVGSISKIKWHEEDSVVIAKMDRIGIIILVIYLSFSLSRRWIFGHWIHGDMLSAFSFSFAAGVILGRFISTRIKIRNVLKEQGRLMKP